jgi:hypothetical protein
MLDSLRSEEELASTNQKTNTYKIDHLTSNFEIQAGENNSLNRRNLIIDEYCSAIFKDIPDNLINESGLIVSITTNNIWLNEQAETCAISPDEIVHCGCWEIEIQKTSKTANGFLQVENVDVPTEQNGEIELLLPICETLNNDTKCAYFNDEK